MSRPASETPLRAAVPDKPSLESAKGRAAYARLASKTAAAARTEIAAVFAASGDINDEPRPITHPVKFFEKGDRPLEIVSSRQWYIRNGGRDQDLGLALIGPDFSVHAKLAPAAAER